MTIQYYDNSNSGLATFGSFFYMRSYASNAGHHFAIQVTWDLIYHVTAFSRFFVLVYTRV